MKKITVTCFIMLVILVLTGTLCYGAAEQEISAGELAGMMSGMSGSLSYDLLVADAKGQRTVRVWHDGPLMRNEMIMDSGSIIYILDGGKRVAYLYRPAENKAMKISFDRAMKTLPNPNQYCSDGNSELTQQILYLGTEVYDSVDCWVVRLVNVKSQDQTKIWLRQDVKFPARIETIPAKGNKMVVEFKNLQPGPFEAALFQIPPDVQITDMSNML